MMMMMMTRRRRIRPAGARLPPGGCPFHRDFGRAAHLDGSIWARLFGFGIHRLIGAIVMLIRLPRLLLLRRGSSSHSSKLRDWPPGAPSGEGCSRRFFWYEPSSVGGLIAADFGPDQTRLCNYIGLDRLSERGTLQAIGPLRNVSKY